MLPSLQMKRAPIRHASRLKIDREKYRFRSRIIGSVLRISPYNGARVSKLTQDKKKTIFIKIFIWYVQSFIWNKIKIYFSLIFLTEDDILIISEEIYIMVLWSMNKF